MKKFSLNKLGIALFCATLIGIGGMTALTGGKAIASTTVATIKSSYAKDPSIEAFVKGMISGLDAGVSNHVYGEENFINLYGLSEKVFGRKYIKDASEPAYSVAKDNNGQLQFMTYQIDNSAEVEGIVKVNEAQAERGAHYLYVQAPLKVQAGFTSLPPSVEDYSTPNTDKFLGLLEQNKIDVLDLRQGILEDGLDQSTLFYNTDHHWRTETAFWGVQKTVAYLKENYGMDLDPEGIYTNPESYKKVFYEKNFLGSQGRRVGKFYGGLDDYTLMLPTYETDYEVTIHKTNNMSVAEGSFEEAIVKYNLLRAKSVFTNRYAAYFGADFPEVVIKNKKVNNDLKVMIVKDSFALPYSAFLSTMVAETHMIDLRYYTDMSLDDYIAEYEPDLILYVYKSINTQK